MSSTREYIHITTGCLDARDIAFRGVPDGVIACLSCHGNGKRVQRYIEGRFTGPCDLCQATGFVYRDTARPVPLSVTNQIAVASGVSFRQFHAFGIDWSRP